LNERIIELIDIAPKEFWGAQDTHLDTIKKYPKLKIVARGTTLKAFGEKNLRRVRKSFSTANASFYKI
jgi:phosphate starvation-inducible PhoH-like protein